MPIEYGGESKEYVAYLLMRSIASEEGKMKDGEIRADKRWLLTTYAECLQVIHNPAGYREILEK